MWFHKKVKQPMKEMIIKIERLNETQLKEHCEKSKYDFKEARKYKWLKKTGMQGEIQGMICIGKDDIPLGNTIQWFNDEVNEL